MTSFPFVQTDAGRSTSKRPKQKNDCTVRAISLVFSIPYDEAYELLQEAGRKSHRGFSFNKWAKSYSASLVWTPFTAKKGQPRMNPITFCQTHPDGTWICKVAKHVFAVKDGVVLDESAPAETKCIYGAWAVKEPLETEYEASLRALWPGKKEKK